jgi:hypothetical protein
MPSPPTVTGLDTALPPTPSPPIIAVTGSDADLNFRSNKEPANQVLPLTDVPTETGQQTETSTITPSTPKSKHDKETDTLSPLSSLGDDFDGKECSGMFEFERV